jgi:outer membrane protein insertion porin family
MTEPGGTISRITRTALAVLFVATLGVGSVFATGHEAAAQSAANGVVAAIEVEGNQRIEADTVRAYMTIAIGDPISNDAVNRSLKALYATGLFADVTMRRAGQSIVVNVVENPIINLLAFEGNKRLKDDELETVIQLRPRTVFTQSRVQADVQRLVQRYRRSGRFAASVEPKVIQRGQNRVDLIFEVSEGSLTEIRKIDFIGNLAFSDGQLRSEIATKEARWYRFLSSDDKYDPDRLTFDRELLRRHYMSKGFADFRVVTAVAELSRDRKDFFVTFTLDEGELYKFGKVDVETGLEDLDSTRLKSFLKTAPSDIYNSNLVEESIQDLTFEVGRLGYAFVDIRPAAARNREKRTIDITYQISEGPRVYIDRIDIVNNVRTLDKVVRREFQLAEGDAFNTAKLRQSRRNIRALGYFEKVDIKDDRGLLDDKTLGGAGASPADDRTVITVDVKEKSTGELSFGAGFSTQEKIVGDISLSERNLLGRGQILRLGLNLSSSRQRVDLSFTEPYFLERDLAAGFDLFNTQRDFQSQSSYDEGSTGTVLRAAFPIAKNLRQSVRYTFRQDTVENVGADASRFIKSQEGVRLTSSVGYNLTYDLRDDVLLPTEGYVARFGQELAGLGGSVRYLRTNASVSWYHPFSESLVGNLSYDFGNIFGLGENVRLSDRYFLGGSSFRGFKVAGVGPRDTSTSDALGGTLYYVGRGSVRFPLGPFDEFGVSGDVFTEFGTLARPDLDDTSSVNDTGATRLSMGVGILWRSPMGPIRMDFTEAIVKESFDETEFFRFSFGTRF